MPVDQSLTTPTLVYSDTSLTQILDSTFAPPNNTSYSNGTAVGDLLDVRLSHLGHDHHRDTSSLPEIVMASSTTRESSTFGDFTSMSDFNISSGMINASDLDLFENANGSLESDYDYSTSDTSIPLDEILPVSFVYGMTFIVGVVGNLLVIAAVARDRRLRSITNIFLTSLACADLTLLCFCVPVKCIAFFSFTWALGYFLCKSVHYCQIVAMVCSVMTLTVMSIERNIAILSPLRSKRICTRRRARVVVLLLWLGSIILALPIFLGQTHKEVGKVFKAYWCIKDWDRPIYGILFESYMLLLLFMVPVCVMIVSYTTICLALSRGTKFWRQATSTRGTMSYPAYPNHTSRCSSTKSISSKGTPVDNMIHNSHRERMDKEKLKVIRMLIVVVVLFVVCWGPILINNLLVAFDVLDKLHVGPLKPLRMAMSLLSYLNSSINPLVYGFMSRHFRRGFRDAIRVCCSRPARRGVESRLHRVTRSNNMSCYYASDFRTSTVRTGTVRLSPVTEQIKVGDEEELDVSPVGSLRYGRKIWARTERVPHNVEDI